MIMVKAFPPLTAEGSSGFLQIRHTFGFFFLGEIFKSLDIGHQFNCLNKSLQGKKNSP